MVTWKAVPPQQVALVQVLLFLPNSPQRVPAASAAAQLKAFCFSDKRYRSTPPNLAPLKEKILEDMLSSSFHVMATLFPVICVTEMCGGRKAYKVFL